MSGGISSDDRGKDRQGAGHSTEDRLSASAGAEAVRSMREADLVKDGFSADEIAKIAVKVPDLNVKILKVRVGDSIDGTSADAVQLVKERECAVVFKFNGLVMVVSRGDSQKSVEKAYMESLEAARKACWTPKRLAEKETKEARDNAELAEHIKTLSSLDFKDPLAPLEWLCKLQELGDMTYCKFDRQSVINAFATAGYTAGMNCDDKFNEKDQENYKGYIIGNALDGIQTIGCPQKVLHHFTKKYQEIFSLNHD